MRFFVLGCGSIGARHTRNLQLLGHSDIIVYDINSALLSKFRSTHNVRSVSSIGEGTALKPDVALVCLPNHLHVSASIELAKAGIHLFIEKPLDLSLEHLPELQALIAQHSLIDMVGCNFRFDAGMQKMHSLLQAGSTGVPLTLHANFGYYLPDWRPGTDYTLNYAAKRETGGGVMLDRIHEFDYVLWLMGEVQSVYGYASRIGNLNIETEDNADIILKHLNGVVSTIHLDYLRREYSCSCEISCSEGILSWDFKHRTLQVYDARTKKWQDHSSDVPADTNLMYVDEIRYYLESVRKHTPTFNTVSDAAQTLQTVLKAKEAVLTR